MVNKAIMGVGVLMSLCATAFAQESILGKYTGNFTSMGGSRGEVVHGLTLQVTSVDGGVVKGTANRRPGGRAQQCAGDYTVEGTFKDNALDLKAVERSGGGASDCGMNMKLKVDGNKLVGTVNSGKAELTK